MIDMETIIAAAITGLFTLIGVVITVNKSNNKLCQEIKSEQAKAQAVTDLRLDELTREVREHNGFAKRMPVVEKDVEWIKEKMAFFHNN